VRVLGGGGGGGGGGGDGDDDDDAFTARVSAPGDVRVAPGQMLLLGVELDLPTGDGLLPPDAVCPVRLTLQLSGSLGARPAAVLGNASLELRCRRGNESFLFTYVCHDGSVQRAGIITPRGPRPPPPTAAPVLLTFHGTGVSAGAQADAYKLKETPADADYAFGVEGYWIVAADRHGAHNWEYTGMWGAMAGLRAWSDALARRAGGVTAAAAAAAAACDERSDWRLALECWPRADTRRVLFAGHSMGGHGALEAATMHAGTALCVAPAAGWLSKEHYGDANAFFDVDAGLPWTDARLRGVLGAAMGEHDADAHLGNLLRVPVHARVGGADATVHPYYSRRLVRTLRALGHEHAVLEEVPGLGHWWWDSATPNDGGVLNDGAMRAFYASCLGREGGGGGGGTVELVLTSVGSTAAPRCRAGVCVLQQLRPFQLSRVSITTVGGAAEGVTLRTSNVARLRILPTATAAAAASAAATATVAAADGGVAAAAAAAAVAAAATHERVVVVNGERVTLRPAGSGRDDDACDICLSPGRAPSSSASSWAPCAEQGDAYLRTERGPPTAGPARLVSSRPMTIVVGTTSAGPDAELLSAGYMEGAVYIANLHNVASEAAVQIALDLDAVADEAVVFGVLMRACGHICSRVLARPAPVFVCVDAAHLFMFVSVSVYVCAVVWALRVFVLVRVRACVRRAGSWV
jgi:hypothetical protein